MASKKIKPIKEISLFLPTYNEEAVIKDTVLGAKKVLDTCASKYEIIIVNDGSRDNTGKIASELAQKYPEVRVITHNPNRGYGGAFKSGLYGSKYELVTFIDSDGQFDFSELKKFLPYIYKYDLVLGYRHSRRDPLHRSLNAYIWKLWMWFLFGLWVKDIDCAFKVIRKDLVDKIKLETESALTSAEFLIKAFDLGASKYELPVTHLPRKAGTQTGANLKVVLRAFRESFKLWYNLNLLS